MRRRSSIAAVEAAPLFGGIGQFAEAVGEFDAADIKLESFGETLVGLQPRKRRLAAPDNR